MTVEQIQELSALTEIAVSNNDIEKLKQIKSIIDSDNETAEFLTYEGEEWFYSLIPTELIDKL
jgi:Asp-tRNA(Asn)/Glu-tRNA(Gln) amidotransferase C subunit